MDESKKQGAGITWYGGRLEKLESSFIFFKETTTSVYVRLTMLGMQGKGG